MAAAPDTARSAAAPAKPASSLPLVLALLVVTGLGTGVGGLFGLLMLPKGDKAPASHAKPAPHATSKTQPTPTATLRALPPVVTNLASPANTWVRIEASLVMEGDVPGDTGLLTAQIGDDMIAFLRTVSLSQIEGASGFQHLREDLNDRVRVRSGGKVRDLVFQSFIVE